MKETDSLFSSLWCEHDSNILLNRMENLYNAVNNSAGAVS